MSPTPPPVIGVPCRADESALYHRAPVQAMSLPYLRALTAAGAAPLCIPLEMESAALRSLFARLDGLLLAGGEDVHPAFYRQEPHPALGKVTAQRDHTELRLAALALEHCRPILGICRGIQLLNVASGGTLYQDLPAQRPEGAPHAFFYPNFARDHLSHTVALTLGSRLHGILTQATLPVNSMHHQGLHRLALGWRAVAHAPDGLVEAVEAPGHPFALGVQWHPEELTAHPDHGLKLFAAFVAACQR
ncbi:MAG: gamma-glutamyl-gamma-aminobutyrate hydrolase family protein [Chloroflexi bacterium]|nr:gamma-glutamyl-gamma-aminobutyrate hydrolase family protein [Chloroflexota bacterium]